MILKRKFFLAGRYGLTIKGAVDVRMEFCYVDTALQVIMELLLMLLISLLYKGLLSQYIIFGAISFLSPNG